MARAADDTWVGTAAGPQGAPQPQAGPKPTDRCPSRNPRQRGETATEHGLQSSSGTPGRSPRCLWREVGAPGPMGASWGWGASLSFRPGLSLGKPKIQNPLPEPPLINCHTQSWGILYKGHRTKSSCRAHHTAALQWPQGPGLWSEPGTRELKSCCGVFSERGHRLCAHSCPQQPQGAPGTLRGRRCSE